MTAYCNSTNRHGATDVEMQVGKVYLSRRGEQVRITAIEPQGWRPVHFVVLTGPYKGVGAKDGSRLMRNGRWLSPRDGTPQDHWNDLVAEFEGEPSAITQASPGDLSRAPSSPTNHQR
jgi:hypothetical protein